MSVVAKNIVWLLVSQLATWAATLVTLIIIPNELGNFDFGAYSFAAGYVMFFTLVAGLGSSTFLARAVARDASIIGPYVWNAVLLKFVLWALVSVVALGLAVLLGNRGETLLLIAIGCGGMLIFIINEVFSGTLAGLQRLARPAMFVVLQVYFQTIFGVLVLMLGWGVVAYAIVMALGTAIPMIATGLMVRPMVRGHRRFDAAIWRLLVVGGIPLMALAMFNLIYATVDVPILHSMSGEVVVGWYALAWKWVGIPMFITTAVASSFFPGFAQHGKRLTAEFAPLVNRALHIVLVVTVPISVGTALVADDLIRFFYEPEWNSAIVIVQILALQVPIAAMDTILGNALIAADRMHRYIYVSAIAAVLNPIACIVAIDITQERYGNGAIGAAIVTGATEVWVMIGALLLRSPGVMDWHTTMRIARILVASAAMVPAVLLVRDQPLVLQIVVGAVTYAVVALAVRAISLTEVRQAVDQISGVVRRRRQAAPVSGAP
jgi:O-antigen/teichoic acid export membrane protein